MSETARESAVETSGVTEDMLEVSLRLLRELGVQGKISKKYSTRDILYEVLRAAQLIGGEVESSSKVGSLSKSEEEWSQFFKGCSVIVEDPEVGRQLLQKGLESAGAFTALIRSIAQDKAVIVPLEDYPGISLFKDLAGLQKSKDV